MKTFPQLGGGRIACLMVGVMIGLSLFGTVSAASLLKFQDGPQYSSSSDSYLLGACADTTSGETVRVQYTTDNLDLTNPPDTGNGTKVVCTLTNNAVCDTGRYWLCSLPAARGVTYKYRFFVTNASHQYYGLVSEQRTFTTSYLAVETQRLSGTSASSISWWPLVGIVASLACAGAWLAQRRRVAR